MNNKQKLILFLISRGLDSEYNLIKGIDRIDFPAELKKNLEPLLNQQLIIVRAVSEFGHPWRWELTQLANKIISEEKFTSDLLDFLRSLPESYLANGLIEVLTKIRNNREPTTGNN